jgi:hypothetical protein
VTTSVNGTTGFTFSDGSVLGSQLGIFNRIIDGGFIVNQRTYVSGTSLPSGTYGHDRWKGGASAGTYTFTQGALGVNTTITITAGSIIQVIEGCNLAEGGTYVLSWTGTAQGRLNGGSYGSSGTVTVTGWTAGTNLNVEFNTGTLGNVQLVAGSAVSSYAYRPYGTELALCQRYYYKQKAVGTTDFFGNGHCTGTTGLVAESIFPVPMRAVPTALEQTGTAAHYAIYYGAGTTTACSSVPTLVAISNWNALSLFAIASGLTTGQGAFMRSNNAASYLAWSAEL